MQFSKYLKIHPTQAFLRFAIGCFVAFWIVVSIPALNQILYQLTDFDLLDRLGSNSLVGWKKMEAWYVVRNMCYGATVVVAFLLLPRTGRLARVFMLIPLLVVYQVTLKWPEWARRDRTFRSEFQHLTTSKYQDVFNDKQFKTAEIRTFEDFYQTVQKKFVAQEPEFQKQWQITDRAELQSIYYTNVVANLWHFGNRMFPEREGCVMVNENTGFKYLDQSKVTVRTYLDSDVACCTDTALMLKFLLDRSQIPNRLVGMVGHLANEIKIRGEWRAYDATVGMTLSHSWEKLSKNAELEPLITFFPIASVRRGNPHYSAPAGGLRMALLSLATHDAPVKPQYTNEVPDYFKVRARLAPTAVRSSAQFEFE
jgi:hypothetical protein